MHFMNWNDPPQLCFDLLDHLRGSGGHDGNPAEFSVWSTSATVSYRYCSPACKSPITRATTPASLSTKPRACAFLHITEVGRKL